MARTGKASLLIVFVTVFIDLLGFGIVMPLLPRYGRHFEADQWLGLLMASFSAMQFVFAPIWGRVSDHVGRRPILIVGLCGSAVFYTLFGYATTLEPSAVLLGLSPLAWLFVSRIGAGIAGATIPTAQAYIADVTGRKDRAKGMALIGAAFGIGFTFGPLLGAAFVTDEIGGAPSSAPAFLAAGLSALAMLAAIFVLPESLRPDSVPAAHRWLDVRAFRGAMVKPVIGLVLFAMFLTTFAFAQFESTLALLTLKLGMASRSNFFVFAYIGLILTLAQGVLVRRLVPRVGEYRMALAGTCLMTVGLAALAFVATSESRGLLYAVLPLSVIGFSALTPSLQAMLSLQSSESEQGGILGLGQSISSLARILGPLVGIGLYQWQATSTYYAAAGLMAVGAVLILPLRGAGANAERAEEEPVGVAGE